MTTDIRRRLKKADVDLVAEALEGQGYSIRKTSDRVEAWCPDTSRYICGFYWRPASKDKKLPGGWRFDVALADIYSYKDLRSALAEAARVQRVLPAVRAFWQQFCSSKSDRRWMEYRSKVAAVFLRHDPADK